VEAVGAGKGVGGDRGEAGFGKEGGSELEGEWGEGGAEVREAVEPSVRDLEEDEEPAGAKDAEGFVDGGSLGFAREKMMEDENGGDGGERAVGEGESGGIATKDEARDTGMAKAEFGEGGFSEFEGGDAQGALVEEGGGGAKARADLEDVVAERGTGEDPGQEAMGAQGVPEARGAEDVFHRVHEGEGDE